MLFFTKGHKKRHRDVAPLYRLPLLCSQPGGVQQELVAPLCRHKGIKKMLNAASSDGNNNGFQGYS